MWQIPEWYPEFSQDTLNLLKSYHDEIIKFQKSVHLVSHGTLKDLDHVHFSDCLEGGKLLLKDSSSEIICDMGSGNGFPGIVLAITEPERKILLVDRHHKKVHFLKHCILHLGLKNAEAICGDIQDQKNIHTVVTRAFGSLSEILNTLDGKEVHEIYCFKGPFWPDEWEEVSPAMKEKWTANCETYTIPLRQEPSFLVKLSQRK